MSLSKRAREGFLLIDNRHAAGPGGVRFLEAATTTCSHCQRQIVRNPARERERAWCRSCDSYICDECEALRAVAGCKTFHAKLDEALRLSPS